METKNKNIIYFTDNRLDEKIDREVRAQLLSIGLPIVSASLQPMDFGKNIHLPLQRGYETYFKQILAALEASTSDVIFFCEHDVLYHPSHFDFDPPRKDTFYYDHNWWKVRLPDGHAVHWDADQVSGLCAYRELLIPHYRKIVEEFNRDKFNRRFEPGSGTHSDSWKCAEPAVDIRYDSNLTRSKWSLADFRDKRTAKNFQEGTCPEWAKDRVSRMV
ncbi:MAG: hypothetical protein WDZ75_01760 [Candidatus Paceibacterota bacterium]